MGPRGRLGPGMSPRSHEPSPRRFDGDKRDRGEGPKPGQKPRPVSPKGPQITIKYVYLSDF